MPLTVDMPKVGLVFEMSLIFPRGPWVGIVTSRWGHEAAENRQNGADASILFLLNAIY